MITGFFVYDPHCNWRHHVGCGSRYLCCFVMTDTVGTYGESNVNKVRDRYRYRITKRRHKYLLRQTNGILTEFGFRVEFLVSGLDNLSDTIGVRVGEAV